VNAVQPQIQRRQHGLADPVRVDFNLVVKESTYFHAALKDRALTGRVGEIAFNSKYYNA
jgi:hypothetical protein